MASLNTENEFNFPRRLDNDFKVLMSFACLEAGRQKAAVLSMPPALLDTPSFNNYIQAAKKALESWGKGLQAPPADEVLSQQIRECLESTALQAANELKNVGDSLDATKSWREKIQVLTAGIDILKYAMQQIESANFIFLLSGLYLERSKTYLLDQDSTECIKLSAADQEAARKLSTGGAAAKFSPKTSDGPMS
jgi:hypothetical protein